MRRSNVTREDIIKEGTRCIKEEVTLAEKITSEELTGNQKKAYELRKEYIEMANKIYSLISDYFGNDLSLKIKILIY